MVSESQARTFDWYNNDTISVGLLINLTSESLKTLTPSTLVADPYQAGVVLALQDIQTLGLLKNRTIVPYVMNTANDEATSLFAVLGASWLPILITTATSDAAQGAFFASEHVPMNTIFIDDGTEDISAAGYTFCMVHSANQAAFAMAQFISAIGWSSVALISTTDLYMENFVQEFLLTTAPQYNINVDFSTQCFGSSCSTQLQLLTATNARVIILAAYAVDSINILPLALDLGILGPTSTYTWLLLEDALDFTSMSLRLRQNLQGSIVVRTPSYGLTGAKSAAWQNRLNVMQTELCSGVSSEFQYDIGRHARMNNCIMKLLDGCWTFWQCLACVFDQLGELAMASSSQLPR